MKSLTFTTQMITINNQTIVKLPLEISEKLPSRGMVMVEGTINETACKMPLEPDGRGSHFFQVTSEWMMLLNLDIKTHLTISLSTSKEWLEPDLPQDVLEAFKEAQVYPTWLDITTKARWEWVRWIRSTANPETRKKRIGVACSKLASGKRRPCCFDQSKCTLVDLSSGGLLVEKEDIF